MPPKGKHELRRQVGMAFQGAWTKKGRQFIQLYPVVAAAAGRYVRALWPLHGPRAAQGSSDARGGYRVAPSGNPTLKYSEATTRTTSTHARPVAVGHAPRVTKGLTTSCCVNRTRCAGRKKSDKMRCAAAHCARRGDLAGFVTTQMLAYAFTLPAALVPLHSLPCSELILF